MAKTKATSATTKSTVKQSLTEQLRLQGADVGFYQSLIDDYMRLWDTKEALANDIASRGVVYTEVGSTGKLVTKNNGSVKDLVAVNRQMLAILDKLGLSPETVAKAMETDEL